MMSRQPWMNWHTCRHRIFEEAAPEIRVTPFEFDTLLRFTDLANPKSPLRLAIEEYFGCSFREIAEYEHDRIWQYCLNILSTVDFTGVPNEDATRALLVSCLEDYRPEISGRLPSCSGYRHGSERIVSAIRLLHHIGFPDDTQTDDLAAAIEDSVRLLNDSLYEDISGHSYDRVRAKINLVRKQLEAAYDLLPEEIRTKYSALNEDIEELQQDLDRLADQVQVLKENDFRSKANNQHSIKTLFYAALDILKSPSGDAQRKAKERLEELHIKAMEKADFWPDTIPRLLGCQQGYSGNSEISGPGWSIPQCTG